jgi:cytochrome c
LSTLKEDRKRSKFGPQLFFLGALFLCVLVALALYFKRALPTQPSQSDIGESNDMLAAADARNGKSIFEGCGACHSVSEFPPKGEPFKVGPNLFGVVGRKIAGKSNFEYSEALKAMHDKTWTINALNDWIRDPASFAHGTKMSFRGLLDPQDRMDVIAYLMTLK